MLGGWHRMNEEPQEQDESAPNAAEHERAERAALVERLFREHNEALLRFLVARLRSPQEAREVAQEAYVRLLSLDEPGAVSYLRAFLFKTAANLAVDRLRREGVRSRAREEPLFQEFADFCTPDRRLAAEQSVERLGRLVAALPAKCRRAFVLNRVHGMSFVAIARELDLSERTVRAYVVRALLYCRAGLDKESRE
jgi:RNA polymerase sigma factor (sigma-70 family)